MADATAELERAAADIALTRDARDILERATAMASKRGAGQASPVDVLKAILADRGSSAFGAIRTLGADPQAIEGDAAGMDSAESVPLRQLLVNANREAQVLGHYQVDSIHLLLALLYSDSRATSAVLQKAGLTLYDLRRHLQTGAGPNVPVTAGVQSRQDRALRRKPLTPLRGALGVSPIFLGLVAITAISGAALWFNLLPSALPVVTIVFVVAGWVVSLCIHEFGHAFVAYLGGDRSVRASGYLTLDPLRYTNIVMSIVFPVVFLLLGGIGLPGGAVYIDHSAIRSRAWDSLVSLAGPVGTLICGLLVAIPFLMPGHEGWITATNAGFFGALAFLGFMEVIALLLNLLPIPGLDGFGVLRPWLPYSLQAFSIRYSQLAIIAVFIVLWNVAPARDAFYSTAFQITNVLNIDPRLISFGLQNMRP
ncbi:MAG TPA: Clp protease N-terminal domain-containing protein [Candidatus Dormibacteraeota bacterium]|nr:Clp protease N-terminal domain-containing protein [Candidatus Dormibacteraeota bacterium]